MIRIAYRRLSIGGLDILYREAGRPSVQLDLFTDYGTNVALYPKFQEYFHSRRPPLLAVWGKNDPYFLPAGAQAFRRDLPDAQVRLLDTGHFALETHCEEIAAAIGEFLEAHVGVSAQIAAAENLI
jgi:pimeloyl-ACP methyl ester carboxylesterase